MITPDNAQKKTFFLKHARVTRAITHGKRIIQNDWLIENDVVITVIFFNTRMIHERSPNMNYLTRLTCKQQRCYHCNYIYTHNLYLHYLTIVSLVLRKLCLNVMLCLFCKYVATTSYKKINT